MLKLIQDSYRVIPRVPGEEYRNMKTTMVREDVVYFEFTLVIGEHDHRVANLLPIDRLESSHMDITEIESEIFKDLIIQMKEKLDNVENHTK